MIKVLFLESVTNFGGSRMASLELAESLKNNLDVEVLDINGAQNVHFKKDCRAKGIRFYSLESKKSRNLSNKSLFWRVMLGMQEILNYLHDRKMIMKYLKSSKPDFIILNCFRTLSYFLWSGHRSRIIYYSHVWGLRKEMSFLFVWLLRTIPSRHICVSQSARHTIYNNGIADLSSIEVLSNRVRTITPYRVINLEGIGINKPCQILHVSGFLPSKGQLVALNVAYKLKKMGFKFRLTLVGLVYESTRSQRFFKTIEKTVQELNLSDVVEIVVNKYDLEEYYERSHVAIFPSTTEGFGRVVLESMSNSIPVVANPVGGVTDMIIDDFSGLLASYNDIEDFANKIVSLSKCPSLYQRISKNAHSLAYTVYNESNVKNRFLKLIKA